MDMENRTRELEGAANVGTYLPRKEVEVRFSGPEFELLKKKGVEFMTVEPRVSGTILVSLAATFDHLAPNAVKFQYKRLRTYAVVRVPLSLLDPTRVARLEAELNGADSGTRRRKVRVSRNAVVQVRWEDAE